MSALRLALPSAAVGPLLPLTERHAATKFPHAPRWLPACFRRVCILHLFQKGRQQLSATVALTLFVVVLAIALLLQWQVLHTQRDAYAADLQQLLVSVAASGGLVPAAMHRAQVMAFHDQRTKPEAHGAEDRVIDIRPGSSLGLSDAAMSALELSAGSPARWCGATDFEPPFLSSCTVPVVIYGWNRPEYFARALRRLTAIAAHVASLPGWDASVPPLRVFLVLHGPHPGMLQAIDELVSAGAPVARTLIAPTASFHPDEKSGLRALKKQWVWMLRQIFDVVPELSAYDGSVIFTEDDMELPLEALHVYRWLSGLHVACQDCWGGALSVGGFSEGENGSSDGAPAGAGDDSGNNGSSGSIGSLFGRSNPSASGQAFVPPADLAYIKAGHTNSGYFFNRTAWRALHSNLDHYGRFADGWDWAMMHLTHTGAWPARAVVPALSRVRNFGTVGLTVTASEYERLGLGASPQSDSDAASFLQRVEAAGAAGGWGLRVEDVPVSTGRYMGPQERARTPEGTRQRCPVCAGDSWFVAGDSQSRITVEELGG